MKLQQGCPADLSDRLAKEQHVYALLDRLGVDYQRVDHPAAMTMTDCAAIDQVLQAPTCKNLLLCNRQCTDFYLLLMPGDKPFKTKELSKQLGTARLSFADHSYMEQFLDITPGSLSVLGLMNDTECRVQLVIDADVLKAPLFGCHPCINTSTLRMATQALVQTVIPAMGHAPINVDLPWPAEE